MFELTHILSKMGGPALAITLTLLAMALASLAVFLERLYALAQSRAASRLFATKAKAVLASETPERLSIVDKSAKGSHLAALLSTGMRTFDEHRTKGGKLTPLEATKRELLRKTEALAADVRRGFGVLASVGSLAPFVGLLGTVVGIIEAFQGIAKEGSGGLGAVSAGISEALVVTAFGLMVAIPAVVFFNYLTAQSDTLVRNLDEARGEFLDFLENRFGAEKVTHG
jgi:biopolymer transport protein ExbB